MKNIYYILFISLFLITGCSSNQKTKELKIKTFKKDGYSFNYFNSWSNDYLSSNYIFTKKSFIEKGVNTEANNFSIKQKNITDEVKTTEDVIMNDIALTKEYAKNINFLIKKKKENNGELYILELSYKFRDVEYKRLGHYRKKNKTVFALICNFEQEIYSTYLNDVMIAFNSFKFKN